MTTQAIEFASNSTGNWFCVAFDADTITSIIAKAQELGIKATAPRFYEANSKAPARFLSYFNGQDTRPLYAWVSKQFTIKNANRAAAAERTVEAEQLENQRLCAKAAISRYTLSEVKSAMVTVIGTPADIREMFSLYNIKVVGTAGLPQCLSLILELGKEQEVLSYLRQPKVEIVEPLAIVPFVETVEAEIVDDSDEYIDIDSVEFTDSMLAIAAEYTRVNQFALPAGIDNNPTSDFEPWTVDELSAYTIKEIIALAELDGIDLTGKKRIRKTDLINYLLPALNTAYILNNIK